MFQHDWYKLVFLGNYLDNADLHIFLQRDFTMKNLSNFAGPTYSRKTIHFHWQVLYPIHTN